MTLWHGRFGDSRPEADLMAFSASLAYDRRLAQDDLAGSRAHVKGLVAAGIYSEQDAAVVLAALGRVEEEIRLGTFVFKDGDEDIHTALERRVTELTGAAGARLHTGRSRNDQVATDLRLYTKRQIDQTSAALLDLVRELHRRARAAGDLYLPGYTHLQRAQPVLLAHHLLAHGWALLRDFERLGDCRRRVDISPLGAGALAGSSLALDPDRVAAELGFSGRFENSLDAVSDRDFVAEALFDLALLGVHLSRLGEEIVLWASEEFGFAVLPEGWSTGSSMLPQKKNPDVAELARGRAGRLIGHLAGFLATLKGLPLAYNRDLQEDKEPLFDAFDHVQAALRALRGLFGAIGWNADAMTAAADSPYLAAVDLAEWLVARQMPFREAHALVGGLVRDSLERHLPLAELVSAHPDLGPEAAALLAPGVAVTRRRTAGGAGPSAVQEQMGRFEAALARAAQRLEARQRGAGEQAPEGPSSPGAPGSA